MRRKAYSSLVIILLSSICVACALGGKARKQDVASDEGTKLRNIELLIPEAPGWDLNYASAILCIAPGASMLAGHYQSLQWPGDEPDSYPKGGLYAEAVDGVVSFRIPAVIWDKTWVRTDLSMDYMLPRQYGFTTSTFSAYYHLPSGVDQSEMSISFHDRKIALKLNITINGVSPDDFSKQMNAVFIDCDLLLDVTSTPDEPLFTGFSLDSPKPLERFEENVRNLPIFRQIPNASGLFTIAMGVDLKPADRNPRHNNTYSATFLIGDDEAHIAEDGTLTASMSVCPLPVEVLAPDNMQDEIFDVWAAAPFKYYTNSTQVLSSNVRITGRKSGILYVQEGVKYEFLITRYPRIKPERRMNFIASELPKMVFDMRGFQSDRVKKKSNNRPFGWEPRDRPSAWAAQEEAKRSGEE